MSNLVLYGIPAFIILMIVEWRFSRAEALGYEAKDTATSISMGLANVLISAVTKLGALAFYVWLYRHRVANFGHGAFGWVSLLVLEDLCYYGFHRAHHEVRLLWAAHENHHSSQRYNLSTALRQSWTTPLTGPWFWSPLLLLGYSPAMVFTAQAWSLLYQFWIHTESIKTLGPLEWIMNTPSHHRVHHGKNPAYLDRNHAGIFIVWDRLFGTFAVESDTDPVRYGLTTDITTFNPARVATHEFVAIARDVRNAPRFTDALAYVFGPPGWSHDGSRKTSTELRAEASVKH